MKATREEILARKDLCYKGWFYANQRIDLLVITISGAGVYVILETMKFALEKGYCNTGVLKFSGMLFIFAIILNMISQFTGMLANEHAMLCCDEELTSADEISEEQAKIIDGLKCTVKIQDKRTFWLNVSSIGYMFVALLTLLIYYLITF